MTKIENYLHEFLLVFFVNRRLIKRVFLGFAVIALLLPLVLKQSFEITAEAVSYTHLTLPTNREV